MLFILFLFRPALVLCAAPILEWTGDYGLWNDGVNPDYGISPSDSFTFSISYRDADNNAPETGYPKVHIKKNGIDISGSPFTLTEADPLDTNYQDGKQYIYSTILSQPGNDYTYSFVAYDSTGQNAYGVPTNEHTLTAVTGYVWVDKVLGNDSTGNGTELNPYQTISKGLNVAVAGQAVRVRGGTGAFPVCPTRLDNNF